MAEQTGNQNNVVEQNTAQTGTTEPVTTINVPAPEAGQRLTYTITPGETVNLEFDIAQAEIVHNGQDLIIRFENGGSIMLENFVDVSEGTTPPQMQLTDGTLLAGDVVITSLAVEDLEAAAGPGGTRGGGVGSFRTDIGALATGLDGIDEIGPGAGLGDDGGAPDAAGVAALLPPDAPTDLRVTWAEDDDVTIEGGGPANTTINVYSDGALIGSTTSDGAGNWVLITRGLTPDHKNVVTATAVNAAGLESEPGGPIFVYYGSDPSQGDDTLEGDMMVARGAGPNGTDDYIESDTDGENAYFIGRHGNDTILAGDGDDTIWGGSGEDHLYGQEGDDTIWAQADDDTLVGGQGADAMDGMGGIDTADYSDSQSDDSQGVDVNLETGLGFGDDAEGDTLANIENLVGSDYDDTLTGDGNENDIRGGDGNDIIAGGAGDDTLLGQDGDDTMSGGEGDDSMQGGEGADSMDGDAGDDTMFGDAGQDTMSGGTGDDVMHGGDEGEWVTGGGESSWTNQAVVSGTIYETEGQEGPGTTVDSWTFVVNTAGTVNIDVLARENATDLNGDGEITSLDSQIYVFDSEGNLVATNDDASVLYGADGSVSSLDSYLSLHLEPGEYTIKIGDFELTEQNARDGFDPDGSLSSGDHADYQITITGVDTQISLQEQVLVDGPGDTMFGNEGNDLMYGDGGHDTMDGGADNDTLYGGTGNDVMFGDTGDDQLFGESGNDTINGGLGSDSIEGGDGDDRLMGYTENYAHPGDGDDTIRGGAGNDYIDASSGNDDLYGDEGNDTVWGGLGEDTIHGGSGDDALRGEGGADTIYGGAGNDTIYGHGWFEDNTGVDGGDKLFGGAGNDLMYGEGGDDTLRGGSGDDTLRGDDGRDLLLGGAGNDQLQGGAGADALYGGAGNDYLNGGDGNDQLFGGSGNDGLHGGSGSDTLSGGAGNDLLRGESGHDELSGGAGSDTLFGG